MCIEEPKVIPGGVYTVKDVCSILEISRTTLNSRRRAGLISPCSSPDRYGYKYLGAEIVRFWRSENFYIDPK